MTSKWEIKNFLALVSIFSWSSNDILMPNVRESRLKRSLGRYLCTDVQWGLAMYVGLVRYIYSKHFK